MFEEVITRLEQRLQEPLPGEVAREKMMATPLNGQKFKLNHEQPPRPGGVMLLLYPHEGKIYLPLTRRPDYNGVHSGQVSFPGGKAEQEDHSLIETALRETEEEIGVQRSEVRIIGQLSEFFVAASNFQVLPVVGYLEEKPRFEPDATEVAAVLEARLDQLLDPTYQKVRDMDVRGYQLRTPYFDVQGNVVWGATAMMLSEFISVLRDIPAFGNKA